MNNQSSYITSLVQIVVLQTAAHAILTDILIVLYVTTMKAGMDQTTIISKNGAIEQC